MIDLTKPRTIDAWGAGKGTSMVWNKAKYTVVRQEGEDKTVVDARQEVQDWLMRCFEPGVDWGYSAASEQLKVTFDCERVWISARAYTALVLFWG